MPLILKLLTWILGGIFAAVTTYALYGFANFAQMEPLYRRVPTGTFIKVVITSVLFGVASQLGLALSPLVVRKAWLARALAIGMMIPTFVFVLTELSAFPHHVSRFQYDSTPLIIDIVLTTVVGGIYIYNFVALIFLRKRDQAEEIFQSIK